MQLTQSLKIDGRGNKAKISCQDCQHDFGPQSTNWKNNAHMSEQRMNSLGSPYTTGEAVLLRSFSCPECGLLLDTELAMTEDEFLKDIIFE
jgi:acetone carboxylase gamma subunit